MEILIICSTRSLTEVFVNPSLTRIFYDTMIQKQEILLVLDVYNRSDTITEDNIENR